MFDYMKVWEQRYKKDDKGEEMFRRDMDLPMKQQDLLQQARYSWVNGNQPRFTVHHHAYKHR